MEPVFWTGRILYGGVFVLFALTNLVNFRMPVSEVQARGIPAASLAVAVAMVAILVGGVAVISGYQARSGLVLIALFLMAISPIMHPFWACRDPVQRREAWIHFFNNTSLLGGTLIALALWH